MKTKIESKITLENLSYLPSFARYILEHKLESYVRFQLQLIDELEIPMMKFFRQYSQDQLFELSKKTSSEFLTFLADNRLEEQMETSIRQWMENQLPVIRKHEVSAEDITMVTYMRKRAFLHFMPDYCKDTDDLLGLIKELDFFLACSETRATNAYINLLKNDISENTHLIEKVNQTIPGAVYVFDIENHKGIYSNNKIGDVIGYDHEELNALGTMALPNIIHPEDQEPMQAHMLNLKNAKDGEILNFKYRVRHKNGEYRWLSSYESVFKRNEDGNVAQTIGITLDITNEQEFSEALRQSEYMYKQAEALTHIGNYVWNIENNELRWSDELFRIYGLRPAEKISFEQIHKYNHPDDNLLVQNTTEKAIAELSVFDFYYRIIQDNGNEKILHARGEVIAGPDGTAEKVIGTAQDVTERQTLIRELSEKQSLYKQAEEMVNMGNWNWDVKNNKLQWSDHLYRLYGLESQSEEITIERFLSFVHPDDREYVRNAVDELFRKERLDYTFRIINAKGELKILRSVAQVQKDNKGNVVMIVGTDRDTTEKQTLIDQLKKSEALYKQAQSLAHVGNWSWDIRSNVIEWSDELYRIYGITRDKKNLSYEEYLELVHPDDREKVISQIRQSRESKKSWEYSHRVVHDNGDVRIISATGEVLTDENGESYMMIGTAQDITERQKLIDRLQQSDALYKQAQSLAKMGNFVWDIATNKVEWSDEVYHIYGLPKETPVAFETAFEPIFDKHKKSVQEAIEQTMQQRTGHSVSYAIHDGEGKLKYINLETDVMLDAKGNVTRILGTAQDITERQALIERLQESEQLSKQAQSLAHLGSWTLDIATGDFSWSDEMYNIFEVEPGAHFNVETWTKKLHPDDRDTVLDYYEECLREKKTYDKIHRIMLPGGRMKIIHRKGEFVLDEKGIPVKMVGTTQDVTKEHEVQRELKENQTFIRKITDATPSIIASYNVNTGKYVFISEGFEKLLGYATSEVMEKGVSFFSDIVHADDRDILAEKNATALAEANANGETDSVIELTYRMRHRNGHYRWFHTYGTIFDRNANHHVEHVLNISLDVTDQMEATQKIKEQEHFIQQIADASPTILYLYDVDLQSIVYINREIFFVLGYLPEEIIDAGKDVTEKLYHPEDFSLLPGRIQSGKSFQQLDSMIQYECRMKNKEEEWRWVLVREIIFKTDDKGNIKQILGAALDINRRKDMEKTILQNTMLLEQSNASLEEFAYVASHDLKEPLRKISTFGDRLVATQINSLAPEGKLYLQKIVDASQRMQTMINDLLAISMITGNTAFEKFSLQKILDETVQTLEYKIEQQNALIEADVLPEANIIPSQFRQLFQNLISNSLKFVRPGVQPVIRIKHSFLDEAERMNYQLAQARQYQKIEFADNGIGFENEFAGKIFAIFQRLHGRSEYEGSGIGLAICKKIVEHHGGIIYATGVPDEGATFTIILPA